MAKGSWFQPSRSKIAPKVREIEILTAKGVGISQALDTVGVSESAYLAGRARLADIRADRMAAMHRGWREAERPIDPKDYMGRVVAGTCPICGQDQGFENFTENLRESGACRACGSSDRQRQMAVMLRERFRLGLNGPLALPPETRVHNTESFGVMHQRLVEGPLYTFSEYWGPEHRPGEIVNGTRHEDLQALSFADNSLDLVMSSDVLEHMPHPYQAHAEIFRVLRPGGAHVFTVPFHGQYQDNVRARLEDGEIRYFGEKLYHGDPIRPDEGVLVWTIFGSEMLDRLQAIGFEAFMWKFSNVEAGIPDAAIVFEARKPGPSPLVRVKRKLRRLLRRLRS